MKKLIASIIILIGVFVSTVSADPIYSTIGIDLTTSNRGYDFEYLNSGILVGAYGGNISSNDADIDILEGLIETALGLSDLELALTDVTVTNSNIDVQWKYDSSTDSYSGGETKPGLSGTWATTDSSNELNFYLVKAGKGYAIYQVEPADNYGSWNVGDLTDLNDPLSQISHLGGYIGGSDTPPTGTGPIPEPGTMILFGSGLIGIAGFTRRRFQKS